jgi:hypothetical protein
VTVIPFLFHASKVILKNPYHPQAFSQRGDALQSLGRWEDAIDEYQKVPF